MNRSAKWGLIGALTLAVVTPMFWHDLQPFPPKNQQAAPAPAPAQKPGTAATSQRDAQIKALAARKRMGNEQSVAKDIARTAALCVRDCRVMLTQISNELAHASTSEERLRLLQQHMKQHSQFVALTLTQDVNNPIQVGHPLRSDLQKQAHSYIMSDNFFVSDLYHKPQAKDAQQLVGMTVGVPLLAGHQVVGSVVADVEMGHLMQVMSDRDRELGTQTRLAGMDGANENLGTRSKGTGPGRSEAQGNVRTEQLSRKKTVANVEGTAWKVHVTALQDRGRVQSQRVQGEVLARFDHDLSPAELTSMTQRIGGKLVRSNSRHTYIFRSDTVPVAQMITYFKGRGAKIAEPHQRLRQNALPASLYATNSGSNSSSSSEKNDEAPKTANTSDRVVEQPNDTFYSTNQWNLPLIKADKGWQTTTGDPKVVIAVVDTGADLNHPDLKGQLVQGYNVIDGSNNPQDDNGHGTHVAGVIAARTNNLEGIAGIDWGGKIMPVKSMGSDGSGSVVDIADGITWAADHGAGVINLSLGEYEESDYLHEAITYAHDKGVVVCAAMGNDGIAQPSYPAAYPEVVAVAADDENKETATFSNFGPHTSVTAPGVAIPSTYPDSRYVALSGTSMATPHVAGVAALIRSINPDLQPEDVRRILETTADDLGPSGKDEYYGAGQVNIAKAVAAAKQSLHQ